MADESFLLTITFAGPNWREKFRVQSHDLAELEPTEVEKGGYTFEVYGKGNNYIELRTDYIVARDLSIVTVDDETQVDVDIETSLNEMPPLSTLTRTDREERHER